MITIRYSQSREPIEDTAYRVVSDRRKHSVVLVNTSNGRHEVWHRNDDFSGYVLVINGIGYEFVRSGTAL